jgi:hypothetical protein
MKKSKAQLPWERNSKNLKDKKKLCRRKLQKEKKKEDE